MSSFLLAFSTLVGTIIGVGLFGLPYVALKSGFVIVALYFCVIGALMICLKLMYGAVCFFVAEKHRLPGYAGILLGKRYKIAAMVAVILSIWAAVLVYILTGGEFLFHLLSPILGGNLLLYQLIFFLAGAVLIYRGIRSVAKTEFFMLVLVILLIMILFVAGLPQIRVENLLTWAPKNIFFPYGVVIFSLWGLDIIPDIKEAAKGSARQFQKIIIASILFCIAFYLLFTLSILGVSGNQTTVLGITGLVPFLSGKILTAGYLFGILTTFTSYIALGMVLTKSFQYDTRLSKELSWFFALFPPLIFFVLGMKNYLSIINLTGAFTLAFDGILVAFMYRKMLKEAKSPKQVSFLLPRWSTTITISILVLGIFTEIFFSWFS